MHYRNWLALGLVALMLAGLWWQSRTTASQVLPRTGGMAMGTGWSLVLARGTPPAQLGRARALVALELERAEQAASNWRPETDISRLNAAPPGAWTPVGGDFAQVLQASLDLWRETGGAFDPTLGAVVAAWGFGPNRAGAGQLPPSEQALRRALRRRGAGSLQLREGRDGGGAEARRTADVEIDLSGVAKGWGVDLAAQALRQAGFDAFLLEVGGEVRTLGRPAPERPWQVGIGAPAENLAAPARGLAGTLLAPDAGLAVATSGDYRNYIEVDGRRLPHIFDPATGRPLRNGVASVSVAGGFGAMRADALATALAVMGAEAGLAWAAERDLAALFVLRTPDDDRGGKWELHSTPQWDVRAR